MTTIYQFKYNDDIYVGSTDIGLDNRILEHRNCSRRKRCNNKFYSFCKNQKDNFNYNPIIKNNFSILEKTDHILNWKKRIYKKKVINIYNNE